MRYIVLFTIVEYCLIPHVAAAATISYDCTSFTNIDKSLPDNINVLLEGQDGSAVLICRQKMSEEMDDKDLNRYYLRGPIENIGGVCHFYYDELINKNQNSNIIFEKDKSTRQQYMRLSTGTCPDVHEMPDGYIASNTISVDDFKKIIDFWKAIIASPDRFHDALLSANNDSQKYNIADSIYNQLLINGADSLMPFNIQYKNRNDNENNFEIYITKTNSHGEFFIISLEKFAGQQFKLARIRITTD